MIGAARKANANTQAHSNNYDRLLVDYNKLVARWNSKNDEVERLKAGGKEALGMLNSSNKELARANAMIEGLVNDRTALKEFINDMSAVIREFDHNYPVLGNPNALMREVTQSSRRKLDGGVGLLESGRDKDYNAEHAMGDQWLKEERELRGERSAVYDLAAENDEPKIVLTANYKPS